MAPDRIAVKVSTPAEKQIKKGHPWIFDQSISKMSKSAKTGDLAILFDQKKNNLFALGLIDMDSPIRIKVIHNGSSAIVDRSFWLLKIEQAKSIREPLLQSKTNAYRLIHGENDRMPGLVVDIYNQTMVVKLYSGIWIPYIETIYNILDELYRPIAIVQRLSRKLNRSSTLEDDLLIKGTLPGTKAKYLEHGLSFHVDVLKGHKTGSFLDHRHNRYKIRSISKGKRVLDVFSYTGGFSVNAAMGEASEVTSIDSNHHALELLKHHMELNPNRTMLQTICGDAFIEMKNLIQKKRKFDLIIIDPPSFAKRNSEVPGALSQYARLAKLASRLASSDCSIVLASCSSRVTPGEFFSTCDHHINSQNPKFQLVEKTFHDIDHPITFPEAAYLKCGYWERYA